MNPKWPCVSPALEKENWRDSCSLESTYELMAESAQRFGSLPAITFIPSTDAREEVQQLSYKELFQHICKAANLIRSLGAGREDVVSVVLPNLFETHEVIWGAEAAAIVNPINPFLEVETIVKMLAVTRARVLVTCLPFAGFCILDDLLRQADQLHSLEAIVVLDVPRPIVLFDEIPEITASGKVVLRYSDSRNAQPEALTFSNTGTRSDVASLFHTGGTTGSPKLAAHSFENEVFTAWTLENILDIRKGDASLVGLPLFHCNAVIGSGLTCFKAGANVVLVTPLGYRGQNVVANFWKLIDRHAITMVSGVPTVYVAAMAIDKEGADISSLRLAMVGAAPLSPDVSERFTQYAGVEMLEGYGLTESTLAASFNPLEGERKVGSVGMRLPNTELKTAHIENNSIVSDVGLGEIGSVVVRGPHVFPGYYQHSNSGLLDDGWLDTGDLGRIDSDGYLWLTGRSKDIIIRGGHNIDPALIEDVLIQHPSVELVAAVGQPDAYAGEVPIAYVQLKPKVSVTLEDLQQWCKERIQERAAVPIRIEPLESLPVTTVGKLFKPPLRMRATQYVVEKSLRDAGIEAQVNIIDDPREGQVVHLHCPDQDLARRTLGDFAFNLRFG